MYQNKEVDKSGGQMFKLHDGPRRRVDDYLAYFTV